ncbi:MAG: hypothetical protein LUI15_08320 [Firmicutes bacterium]|nr:hypothetical protein [Bacillota bacterium]MCD7943586.1 hypothetical protein [Clostridia bacterium]MCD8056706.1 hypothetical protein [Clostridiales bacterium]MCD7783872.1 hypothetical protein [Bacillota bacterium]MCD7788112.1 hypothetical protein [Bacillota bacterium]
MLKRKIELHDVDITDFIHALDSCTGDVYLETEEGDCINLKSRLSQLLGIATIIKGGSVTNASLRCENAEDESKLFRFNLFGEVSEKGDDENKA